MKLTDYLEPSVASAIPGGLDKGSSVFGKTLSLGTPNLSQVLAKGVAAIIGVNESRNSNNPGAANAPDAIRQYLYSLSGHIVKRPLVDLGNLQPTSSPAQTYSALRDVVAYLLNKGVVCVVLGGTHELTWPLYQALKEESQGINLSIIDSRLDMGDPDGDFSSSCFIDKLTDEPRDNLFVTNLMGHQGYFCNQKMLAKLQESYNETIRLGAIRDSMSEVEPYLRDSHLVSMDMSSIRQSDCPGSTHPSPNGLYAEEACQLARFAGHGESTKVFGLFELNPAGDAQGQSQHLAAQIVWHFLEAFFLQRQEISSIGSNLKKFFVKSPIPNIQLVFLKDTINNRWWMEFDPKKDGQTKLVACSYTDYYRASKGEVPDRWLRAWKKMI